jgi:Peptidase family M23
MMLTRVGLGNRGEDRPMMRLGPDKKRWTRARAAVCGCLAIALPAVLLATASPSHGIVAGRTGSTAPSSARLGAGLRPGTKFTPVTATTLTVPEPVEGSDGRIHLVYELLLTNAAALPVRISQVEVLDAATNQALLNLKGTALSAEFTPVGAPAGDEGSDDPASPPGSTTIPSSATWVVWLDVSLPPQREVPRHLVHRVIGELIPPGGARPIPFDDVIKPVRTSRHHAVVLSPPVKGGIWYMSEGCCNDNTHHRRGLAPINGQLSVPQRFAIDFFKVDNRMRAWAGDPSKITSYFSYRQPVVAAAAGTVVDSEDGLPNSTALPHPPPVPPIDQTVGNHVTVRIGPGLYALYAHLDPGTVKVHIGEKVSRGELLGLIGTSGNSTTPHLHFEIMTTPEFFPTDSVPYVFDQFRLLGRVPDRIWDDNLGLQPTGKLPFAPAKPAGLHHDQLPLDRDIVRFRTTR